MPTNNPTTVSPFTDGQSDKQAIDAALALGRVARSPFGPPPEPVVTFPLRAGSGQARRTRIEGDEPGEDTPVGGTTRSHPHVPDLLEAESNANRAAALAAGIDPDTGAPIAGIDFDLPNGVAEDIAAGLEEDLEKVAEAEAGGAQALVREFAEAEQPLEPGEPGATAHSPFAWPEGTDQPETAEKTEAAAQAPKRSHHRAGGK